MEKLIPVGDTVIVELVPDMPVGIAVPETVKADKKTAKFYVVAIGPGIRSEFTGNMLPIEGFKTGERVILCDRPFAEKEIDGRVYLMVKAGAIGAVVANP